MKSNSFRMISLATGLLALSTLVQAQTPVRDSDNEARNADQPPAVSARWEGEGSLACGFTVFGYLVDKPLLVK